MSLQPDSRDRSSTPIAKWARDVSPSALQLALIAAANPDVISLSLGLPDPDLFPTEGLAEAAARVLRHKGKCLQYGATSLSLRTAVCQLMADRGVECTPSEIFITSGAQQGISLLVQALMNKGATVCEESLSYTGFQQAIQSFAPHVVTIPTSPCSGIDLDALEQFLVAGLRPSLLYVMADGHNPLGATMPLYHRRRIAQLAQEFRLPLIEDDPYGFLNYEGPLLPPIRSFNPEWVFYIGSFSKLLSPGLRVGWVVVPRKLIPTLEFIKEAADINTCTVSQGIVAEFLAMDQLRPHLGNLIEEYGSRCRGMATELRSASLRGCQWKMPRSGAFFWIELPSGVKSGELLQRACESERVSFLPAEAFSRGRRSDGMRLNFTRNKPRLNAEAVRRLAKVVSG